MDAVEFFLETPGQMAVDKDSQTVAWARDGWAAGGAHHSMQIGVAGMPVPAAFISSAKLFPVLKVALKISHRFLRCPPRVRSAVPVQANRLLDRPTPAGRAHRLGAATPHRRRPGHDRLDRREKRIELDGLE